MSPDGRPGTVHTLSAAGMSAWNPRLAVDSDGRVTVVWYASAGSHVVQAVRLDTDGTPGTVHTISGAASRMPVVAVDSQGRATVAWHQEEGGKLRIQAARIGSDGVPGPVRPLCNPGEGGFLPALAVDSQDRVTVAWRGDEHVEATRIDADGQPGAVLDLSDPAQGDLAEVAIDSQDRATVVWQQDIEPPEHEGPDDGRRVKSIRLGADGQPGVVRTRSGPGLALGPRIAIDSRDGAVLAWEGNGLGTAEWARIGADEMPGLAQILHPSADNERLSSPDVATDSRGGAMIVWESELGDSIAPLGSVKSLYVGADDVVAPVRTLSLPDSEFQHRSPDVAIGPTDRVAVAWERGNPFTSSVQVALADWRVVVAAEQQRSPARGRLRLRLKGKLAQRRVVLWARCVGGARCSGALTVRARVARTRRARSKRVVVARGRYRLAAGELRRIKVKVTKGGWPSRSGRKGRSVRAWARIGGNDASSRRAPLRIRMPGRGRP